MSGMSIPRSTEMKSHSPSSLGAHSLVWKVDKTRSNVGWLDHKLPGENGEARKTFLEI